MLRSCRLRGLGDMSERNDNSRDFFEETEEHSAPRCYSHGCWMNVSLIFQMKKIKATETLILTRVGANSVISRGRCGTSGSIFVCHVPACSSELLKSLKIIGTMNKMCHPLSGQACCRASVYSHSQMGIGKPILSDGLLGEKARHMCTVCGIVVTRVCWVRCLGDSVE